MVILDRSGSIRPERFEDVKAYLVSLLDEFEIMDNKVRVACVTFSNDATVVFYLDSFSNLQDVSEAILRVTYEGQKTNIARALEITRTEVLLTSRGDRVDAPVG